MRMQHIAAYAYVACNLSIDFIWDIPAWDLLLIGCQAPGLFSGRPPQEMGARPQGIFFWKASTRNGCQAPGHSFGKAPLKMGERPQGILPGDQKQSKNNPEKSQKNIQKDIFQKK